jgi:ABC-type polysaccharide/polyol phosphate transport system ATPase subunit
MPPMIECRAVSKRFVIRHNRHYLLKERVLATLRPHLREARQEFWALRDVDLAVDPGEAVALIGPNGAGKSTLFRIIAGIFVPTAGCVRLAGRIAPLLALGVGFHQELSGRENIYLNAALFGLAWREIQAVEAAIVAFSELDGFIDAPMKSYSTGMQLRLGFSIATHVRADIYLIDEVLAVGDQHFKEKCHARLTEERRAGRTFLVATHDLAFVERECDRAALLVGGHVAMLGAPDRVVQHYRDLAAAGAR